MNNPESTTTGIDRNLMAVFAEFLDLATTEPGSIDEANEILYAIEDAATKALFR